MNGPVLASLLVSSVWLDRPQYEAAETKSEETKARAHSGLLVEGKQIPKVSLSSDVADIFGEARSMIAEGLQVSPSKAGTISSSGGDSQSDRVKQLEKENEDLKKRVSELESFIASKGLSLPSSQPDTKKPAESDGDDDFDPFASDDEDEEEKAEAEKLKQERLAAYQAKKSKKPALIAKSSIIWDIKPWDDETDMAELEKQVRSITKDGLEWKGSELKPIAYGIKKLQIISVVEDDKVGTEDLEEEICALEDLVQSVDIVAFNKL